MCSPVVARDAHACMVALACMHARDVLLLYAGEVYLFDFAALGEKVSDCTTQTMDRKAVMREREGVDKEQGGG